MVVVQAEKHDRLPPFNPQAGGWVKGVRLQGLLAQECTVRGLLDPASLQVRDGPQADAAQFELGKDYGADLDWASIGRLPNGRIGENQPVYVSYRYVLSRIDSIVLSGGQRIELREGKPQLTSIRGSTCRDYGSSRPGTAWPWPTPRSAGAGCGGKGFLIARCSPTRSTTPTPAA
jgi:hypothetical protein